ncbi:Golgi casein kinase, C-terminal, Fam20 [Popillia japonica]|uniref:Golgi casein kinase, C-terminal, Fam20 n=1 Tax=Popillia japonica TaxID=7064 RepID=A0AAW1LPA3_POPJA
MFFIITINLVDILSKFQSEVIRTHLRIEDKIKKIQKHLPKIYYLRRDNTDLISNDFIQYLKSGGKVYNLDKLWNEVNSWVTKTQLYSIHPKLGDVLFALQNAKIVKCDLDNRGSQLKFLLTLEGDQEIIFKPKWYKKDEVIEGVVYAGKDRYGSEILGFYISGLFEKPIVPISAERIISFKNELLPVATEKFLKTTLYLNNRTCVYGTCYYCNKNDPICENSHHVLSGAAIFNIKGTIKVHKSPWRRIYKAGKIAEWQANDNYCKIISQNLSSKRILDFIDVAIFDFLIQNGDRHHYETLNGNLLWLDNGKGLGNPNIDHIDILAPLYQCCQIRKSTWSKLLQLSGGVLKEKLKLMPNIGNFVTDAHLDALERRLLFIYATVEFCMSTNKEKINIL